LSEIRLDELGEKAFALLSAAERSSRTVRFSYVDKEGRHSERTVDPYGFILSTGRVYVVGYDHTRKEKRVFAVDNILNLDTLGATFVKPADFNEEEFAAASISGVLHSDQVTEVRVRFNARVAKAAVAARVVADRAIERNKDGSVEIAYNVADVDELVRWILGWGAQAEVLGPDAVRTRMLDLIAAIRLQYNSGTSHLRGAAK
ncbi:MAG: WYL domain-containing protein, partial [Candidatus Eremiobacteraeota bacterium]|nr:WYL domain-containing protein [Candidatus Eremiobacteraeota bacterium]